MLVSFGPKLQKSKTSVQYEEEDFPQEENQYDDISQSTNNSAVITTQSSPIVQPQKIVQFHSDEAPAPNILYPIYSNYQEQLPDVQNVQKNFRKYTGNEKRLSDSHKSGGKVCKDKNLVSTLRNVSKEIISQIGKKILSGNFNLTTISFPIKAMIPKSALECVLYSTCQFPFYMNIASSIQSNPLERFKLVIAACISSFSFANTFYKPLNPILGETFEGQYIDGTNLYAEQISHHPPISYFYVKGGNNKYKAWGNANFEASAGLNSLKITNKGKRYIKFLDDNQLISFNTGYEVFSGTFFGETKHESLGKLIFEDIQNDIYCKIKIGKCRGKPSDYLQGDIIIGKKVVSKVFGTYLGYLNFDDINYWDFEQNLPFKSMIVKSQLGSDHSQRADKQLLLQGYIEQAQQQKELYEQIQRKDNELRKNFQKHKQKHKN